MISTQLLIRAQYPGHMITLSKSEASIWEHEKQQLPMLDLLDVIIIS